MIFLTLTLYLLKNLKKKVLEKETYIQELSCLFQNEKVSKFIYFLSVDSLPSFHPGPRILRNRYKGFLDYFGILQVLCNKYDILII